MRYPGKIPQGGYEAYNAYISAATRYAAMGAPTLYMTTLVQLMEVSIFTLLA